VVAALAVLDVNVLRDQAVVEACIARFDQDGSLVALPEIALFELTKHPDRREETIMGSLQLLARRPEAVVLARSTKPLGVAEEASGVPTASVIATTTTDAFRRVLRDVGAGAGADLQTFLNAVERYRGLLDHERHARDTLQTVQTLKRLGAASLPRDLVARIGRDLADGDRSSFRNFLGRELLVTEQRHAHVRRGVPHGVADALLVAPSLSYLFALAIGVVGLEWVFKGGIEGADERRVANDVLDIEYVLAGLWVGLLISRDAGARSRLEDMKVLGKSAWPTHAAWFDRARAIEPQDAPAALSS
jgi:hypothetical protein